MTNQNQQNVLENIPDLIETTQLNNLFRVIDYSVRRIDDGSHLYTATVFNDQATIKLTWINEFHFLDLDKGAAVRVLWMTKRFFINATNIVAGVERVKQLKDGDDIFTTIPNSWLPKKIYFRTFLAYLNQMDYEIIKLVQHVCLDQKLLYSFLNLPYSKSKPYNRQSGNLCVTTLNLESAGCGTHHQEFQTDRKVLMVALMMVGLVRHVLWEYDANRKRFFIPLENQRMKLNILAGRLFNQTAKQYKIELNADFEHELDKVFKNQKLEDKLTGLLW